MREMYDAFFSEKQMTKRFKREKTIRNMAITDDNAH